MSTASLDVGMDVKKLRAGDRRTLAKAITLIESSLERHQLQAQALLEQLLPHTGDSIRIAISGVPGVGKSTFVEAFGKYLLGQGLRIAVLAVDPSSARVGGSILGDKTRMAELSRSDQVFIRPSPASGALGGVARRTRESLLLCEAAGYQVILIETVGVGQSEYEAAAMVDFFLLLLLPNAGDELQGIKRGIIELADALVINKADGENLAAAERSRSQYQAALRLLAHEDFWQPQVLCCSALEGRNIDRLWQWICDYRERAGQQGHFLQRRREQNRDWMHSLLHEMMEYRLRHHPQVQALLPELESRVAQGATTAYLAARQLMDCFGFSPPEEQKGGG